MFLMSASMTSRNDSIQPPARTSIVFHINASNQATVADVKTKLKEKIENLINTIDISYDRLSVELDVDVQAEICRHQSPEVNIEIGELIKDSSDKTVTSYNRNLG